ncbi:hypothetical protein AZI86_09285 [Bdellovibrio bacteriovorus]|uniref:Amidase n=1 Tax=Bdellovibrio bacteriovorus TaxID=959 RepID=A0A150WRV6_BDEBC|nr:L,D-transpeptidase family protein [Bdellovibrio bacteriovorus]KYG67192.1 hypothetical protein AZI86_09285 [Bdellovibrio bacteriovorus]
MGRVGLIFFILASQIFFLNAQAQSKQAEYLAVLEELSVPDMRNTFYYAAEHGINVKSYWTDAMESTFQRDPNGRELRERTKLNYLRLLTQMNAGLVDPSTMGEDVRISAKSFLTADQLRVVMMAQGRSAQGLLENFAPRNPPYLGLKEAYRRMVGFCNAGQWNVLPRVNKSLRVGVQDSSVGAIKTRLRQFGYAITSIDNVYDKATEAAIRDVQWNLRFKPDGVVSPGGKTLAYLNTGCVERLRQIRIDMDKMRWFPQNFEPRHIFVNLAMSYLNLVDPEQGVNTSMRTINGRSQRKSPTMIDKIVYVVINPFWVVPPTIFREDKLADIRGMDPYQIDQYFARNNYEVWNAAFTRKYIPSSIDWWSLRPEDDKLLYIRQRPSLKNALGGLKFMMTNGFAIYLHDTNQRELFVEPDRLLSSGCVRVERPLDLAETLLAGTEWDRTKIQATMAKPGEVMKTDTDARLKKAMPVYMVFLTSQMSSDGVLRFAEDTYAQSGRMLQRGAW